MTTEEIKAGNKQIALFMGAEFRSKKDNWLPYYRFEKPMNTSGQYALLEKQLRYHESYDWLMPVWNKIMELGKSEYGINWKQRISEQFIEISNGKNLNIRHLYFSYNEGVSMEEIYRAAVQFIEWHNANNK